MNVKIRRETTQDDQNITVVNNLAFGQKNEGELIRRLRQTEKYISGLSLVAEIKGRIVGHILFYPIEIKDMTKAFPSLALAPMAVLPEYQRQGIGVQLVREGLKRGRKQGFK